LSHSDNDKVITDWEEEEKRLQEEYKRRLQELKSLKETSEGVGQVLTRGLLPVIVLHLLSGGRLNGNEIVSEIGRRTNGGWVPSTGGIYPILRKLEKKGLVVGEWEDPDKRTQRLYQLTPKGEAELASLKTGMKPTIMRALNVFQLIVGELFGGEASAK